jgi:Uma2 family endonuclease
VAILDKPALGVPPLESGDRLTRAEFERRYAAMPHVKKAELVEGVVYMPSAVRAKQHAEPHSHIVTWLGVYAAATPGVMLADNATVRLDLDNEVQPDALLRLPEELGGRSRLSDDDYVEGAPELIAEIAASSASYDLHDKLKVYRRSGVQEYVVWQVYENKLSWFHLHEGEYIPLMPDAEGVIHSLVFPGLRLAPRAMVAGDLAGVLATLQGGIASPAHEAFVKRLNRP